MKQKLVAEFLGAFAIVFAGCGAIIANAASGGAVSHAGIALTFGLIVMVMIYCFGDVSGAHFNPAVTVAFAAARRFPWREVPGYAGAQMLGAVAASALLLVVIPHEMSASLGPPGSAPWLGATIPAYGTGAGFIFEAALTFLLMMVVLSVSTGAKEKGITAGIAVGGLIALEAMFAGPICGASMNPARSLGPAVVSGHLAGLWIYLTAPVLGALLAVPVICWVRPGDCCPTSAEETFLKAS